MKIEIESGLKSPFIQKLEDRETPGITKRGRLSLLTNSAFVYESKCGGGGVAGSQPMSTAVHITRDMEPK